MLETAEDLVGYLLDYFFLFFDTGVVFVIIKHTRGPSAV